MSDELLHPDAALEFVLEAGREACLAAGPGGREILPLAQALGRVLPAAVFSTVDHPPFDKSAMDGFAVAEGEARVPAPGPWLVRATVAAGAAASVVPGPGEAVRVMTGAPVPPGTRFVQRVEWTEADPDGARVAFTRPETGGNIIRRGENLRSGEVLLGPRVLLPGDIGLLASSGYAAVEVARRPRVGVISTGDELVPQGGSLGPAAIFDSNGPQLAAQALAAGAEPRSYGIVADEAGALQAAVSRALAECDVVILSGGVSMGDFDFVPSVLESLGVKRIFHRVAMRPGKPTWFGRSGAKAVFGLPGNPLSTFVNFEVFIRPHLAARAGLEPARKVLVLPAAVDIERRGSDRVEYLPVGLATEEGRTVALPLRYHGSSMLSVLSEAEGLARLDIGVERIAKGGPVDVRLLRA